ncbi:RagB/SusD family nutrient uptake outer membrane protein [Mucilaginibacter robiniae]|uniref:RagB/SusD family nutrient uptake outer membrane protein n=1 Tax=Mucilaginibacter robiniae TaxID=2728022 RepID=A0A7L5E5U5_9SPHI|nr:RagB/SusD family nutrient uptake outer membrane protein [Mucilaginibacter robiniae]QJD96233.1 RagB/SusD family nutrient uptake outer membrane protein [Mucilaginibacter robiniae]
MTHKPIFQNFQKVILALLFTFSVTSCKKYVDIDVAPNLLEKDQAFTSDASATSALLSIYSYYPTTYCLQYFTYLGGLEADDLQYPGTTAELQQFAQSAVLTTNSTNESYLWTYPYQVIRETNLAIDGISKSTGMSAAVKSQLTAEAKFIRAFMFFNLVNYMGGVPLILDPTELNNAAVPRSTADAVYAQIITDLKDAQSALPATYAGTASLKARVNKWAATALLARVYLYRKDYANAEAQATQVISSGTYSLPALSNVFINTSSETILQFSTYYGYSTVGASYRTSTSTMTIAPPTYTLHNSVMKSFESGDGRKIAWVDSTIYNGVKYYRIYKYKLPTSTVTGGNEYNVVLRLAEQYLIRAEARAQQGNISGAQSDLNLVRARAGLTGTTATTQAALLTAIAAERKVELFGESAHRWFDLKRTGQADAVLGPLKSSWKSTAVLMPVPYNQILLNTSLTQNPGY